MFNATGIYSQNVSCHYFIISYDDEIKDFNKRDCNSGNKEKKDEDEEAAAATTTTKESLSYSYS